MTATTQINQAMALQKPLEDYIHFLERLNSRSLKLLGNLAAPGMRYVDPLRDVQGVDEVIRAFEERIHREGLMKIRITDTAFGRESEMVYIRWQRRSGDSDAHLVEGISEVLFSNDGRVLLHKDYYAPFEKAAAPRGLWARLLKQA